MNKKFSTLVAALLASGGLFYAVDAMILPAGDGVAQKYVMVDTRAGAVAEDYSVKVSDGKTFEEATKWTAEDIAGFKFTTANGSFLYLKGTQTVALAKAGADENPLAFTVDASGYLKVGAKYFVSNANGLELKSEVAVGDSYICAYSEGATIATSGGVDLSATTYVLAVYKEKVEDWNAANNKALAFTAPLAAALPSAAATASFDGKTIDIEQIDGSWLAIKLAADQYLAIVNGALAVVTKADLTSSAAEVATNSSTGLVTVGGENLNLNTNLTIGVANCYLVKSGEGFSGGDLSNAIFKSDLEAVDGVRLVSASNIAAMGSDGKELDYAAPEVTLEQGSSEGLEAVDEIWTYNASTKQLRDGIVYLKAADADGGVVSVSVDGASAPQVSLDEDGAIKIGTRYLVFNSAFLVKDVPGSGDSKQYLYEKEGGSNIVKQIKPDTKYVIGDVKMGVASFTSASNSLVPTEQDAVEATPGSEIPGMEDVKVDEDGTITPEGEAAKNIVAPVEISLGSGDFLSIGTDNKVITVKAADVSVKASWILKDSKYMSVALDRAGVDKKYLKYTNPTNGGLNLQAAEVVAQGFELVADPKAASVATFSGTTITLDSEELTSSYMKVSDQANPEAPATSGGQALVAEVGSDSYLLSAKDGKFVADNAAGFVDATNDPEALWKVETTTLANGVINYSFYHMKDGKKTYLDLEGKVFTAKGDIAYFKGVMLTTETGKWVRVNTETGALEASDDYAAVLGLYEAGATAYSAAELNKFEGAGFSLTIDTKKDAKATIKGADMFAGKLTATGDANYRLQTADGKYIVLLQDKAENPTWGKGDLDGKHTYTRGYKFATVNKATDITDGKHLSYFRISHAAGSDSKDLIVEVMNGAATGATAFGRLYIAEVNGEYMLTTTDGKATTDVYPYVVAGNGNAVTLKALVQGGRFVNISYVNSKKVTGEGGNLDRFGKVYTVGLNDDGKTMEVGYAKLGTEVLASSPETQWAISGKDGAIIFANREQPTVKTEALALYATAIPDVYSIEKVNTANGVTFRDTIRLTYVENTKKFDGFMFAKENQLRNQRYNLSAVNKINEVTQQMYWAENTGTHKIGLDGDSENASKWKLSFDKKDLVVDDVTTKDALIDTVLVISNVSIIKDNKVVTVPDTLAILPYIFQNAANSEYVKFNDKSMEDGKFYICDKDKVKANATRFALKMRPDSTYHFVTLNTERNSDNTEVADYANPFSDKLYGDRINNWLGNASNYSVAKGNDLMAVTPLDVPEYRQVAFGDTIRIYREENDSQVMYEKRDASVLVEGQAPSFLNIDNVNQFTKINPAIFVDTAYVNREAGENTRYQYLLAVNVEEKTDAICPLNPEHNTQAWRDEHNNGKPCPDAVKSHYLKGRFLINLMDTANVYEAKQLHSKNPYIDRNEAGEVLAKLAFVEGYHLNDTLFIQRGNGEYVKLELGAPEFNIAKFAFHYVNYADGTFKIQTQIKNWKAGDLTKEDEVKDEGYLKWINGTVVVADGKEQGDVFNLNEDETRIPTANEGINASEVSVIAKEGAVVINGAAGKKVTISNVLGQTIANTVLSSDNATLSAPAGIVVVAVEGEAAVKAIVK